MSSKVGHYELLAEFASGGMASVHFGRLVRPGGFTKTVAIKRLRPEFAKNPSLVSMLLHEAQVTGVVEHANVVSTLDVVQSDEDVFVVMEYVRGDSLANVLTRLRARGETAPPRIVSAIVSSVLHGLHAAHEATDARGLPLGIVHRDVSPQNVLLGLDGIARLSDFGVATSMSAAGEKSDEPRGVVGKLAYLAPETIKARPATVRTDIYGVGIVLWEALTGRRLFTGADKREVLDAAMTYTAPPPSRIAPAVPPALDEITLRALERDESGRYASAREMAIALEMALPPALPSECAEWVAPIIRDVVDTRAELFAVTATTQDALLTFAATGTAIPIAPVAAPARAPTKRARAVWLGVPLLAAAAASILVVALRPRTAETSTRPVELDGATAARALESAAPAPPESPASSPLPPAPPTHAVATPTARPRYAPPRAPPSSRLDCSKKFTIDAEGHMIFRKECL